MHVAIESSWKAQLKKEFDQPYFLKLVEFVKNQYVSYPDQIFPQGNQIFRAFDACPFEKVKVVILGQDPYPTKGHAHGLCFSVEPDVRPLPKSLNNIYKELNEDLGITPRTNGDLNHWAEQGVLLLNATLTVKEGTPESHAGKGWEMFTDAVIQQLNESKQGVVYLLWGSKAIRKAENVDRSKNVVLTAPHPSPLSAYRGFFGCKHFSKTNDYLTSIGKQTIDW
ncbi:MAG: uracil-DNA glycosylase [Crocinitomicaceae bacterium]|nr:uracil-DNA glycosylase [Crocinitomicaceae bacterium]